MADALYDDPGQVVYTGGVYLCTAASSVGLSADRQRALLVDFSCAVHRPTVVDDDDLVDVVRDLLPPHLIPPEVSDRTYRVHSVLEKSLKMLEFGIKTLRPLKVFENR